MASDAVDRSVPRVVCFSQGERREEKKGLGVEKRKSEDGSEVRVSSVALFDDVFSRAVRCSDGGRILHSKPGKHVMLVVCWLSCPSFLLVINPCPVQHVHAFTRFVAPFSDDP